jgi:hypothetical protein
MRLTGENQRTRGKPVPVPLCPPQIPHGLTPGSNPGLRGGRPAANRLSHGTAKSTSFWPHTLSGHTYRDTEHRWSNLFLCVMDRISLHMLSNSFAKTVDKIQNTSRIFCMSGSYLYQYRCLVPTFRQ